MKTIYKLLGMNPPQEKRKKNTTKEANMVYDKTKRKKSIVPSWKSEFGGWSLTDMLQDITEDAPL